MIIIQRHGNALRADRSHDKWRPLSYTGIEQRDAMRARLRELHLHPPDLVISSPAFRAIQTVEIEGRETHHLEPLYMVPSDTQNSAALDVLCHELKHAPLATYREHDTTGAVERWTKRTYDAFVEVMRVEHRTGPKIIHVGTHAIIGNALAAIILEVHGDMESGSSQANHERILNHPLGEAGCIVLDLSTAGEVKVEIIELPV